MTKGKKSIPIFIIYLLIGALIGGVLGEVLANVTPYLGWMALGKDPLFNIDVKNIDVYILSFGFNFSMSFNVGSLIGIIVGIIIWKRS